MKDSIYFILFIASILGLIRFIIWYGKRQAKLAAQELKYDIMYLNIQVILGDWDINEKNYHAISGFIDTLDNLPYKDEEHTSVLKGEFGLKYEDIRNELRSEEEFSPEAVLRK